MSTHATCMSVQPRAGIPVALYTRLRSGNDTLYDKQHSEVCVCACVKCATTRDGVRTSDMPLDRVRLQMQMECTRGRENIRISCRARARGREALRLLRISGGACLWEHFCHSRRAEALCTTPVMMHTNCALECVFGSSGHTKRNVTTSGKGL